MAGASRNLDEDFASFEKSRQRVRCATCKLEPELRTWAESKVLAGHSMAAVVGFLATQNYIITTSAFKNHMDTHVEAR